MKEEEKDVEIVAEVKAVEEINEQVLEDNRKGLSIASMVLGICSIVFCSQFIISVTCRNSCCSFRIKR